MELENPVRIGESSVNDSGLLRIAHIEMASQADFATPNGHQPSWDEKIAFSY